MASSSNCVATTVTAFSRMFHSSKGWDSSCGGRVQCCSTGWPATLECGVFCLPGRGVGRGKMPLMSAEEERNSRKWSLSLLLSPCFPTLTLPFSFPSLPLSEATVPQGTTTALSCPCEHTHPSSAGAVTCASARETQGCCPYSYPHRCPCIG